MLEKIKTIKNFINKNKKLFILFICFFVFYFILGTILSYYLNTANYWSVLFDMDTPRVLGDLSLMDYNHYRVSVHPLFVILFQPIVIFLNLFTSDSIISIILLQSFFGASSVLMSYLILNKITNSYKISLISSIIFGLSFGQVMFTASIETYIFAQFFLLLMWLFAFYKVDKKFEYWDYVFLVLLGIGSIAVTITNFIQFIIMLFFVVTLNKKINKPIITSIVVIISVISLSVFLAEIQNIIWPSAPNFFTKGITDFINRTSEENLYINYNITMNNVINVMNSCFAYSLNIPNYIFPDGAYLIFKDSSLIDVFSMTCGIILLLLNIIFIIKTKFKISKNKIYYALSLSLLFNLCLHLIYGNAISYLYICHFNFLLMFNIIYILNEFHWLNKLSYLYIILIVLMIFSIKNIIQAFLILFSKFPAIEYFRKLPIVIVCFLLIVLILLIFKNKKLKVIFSILILIISIVFWGIINDKIFTGPQTEITKYEESIENYENQLKIMKNSLLVKHFSQPEEPINIFFFGMADRTKYVYKDGKLINIKNKEVEYEFDYTKEIIIPNDYTVILQNKEEIYKIYENEDGIFLNINDEITVIDKGSHINLPEFENYKYSEILKVLHQEILFNIDGSIPKPNIFGYSSAWYRDAMLATMVLEYTNNTDLLIPWVKSIKSIYDYSRSKDIKETDNLGELLYILGAVGVKREDLISDVLIEIENLKQEDGSIKGMVDGLEQKYYPTVLAIFGAKKLGITLDLVVPQYDDSYAKLTWYSDYRIATDMNINSKYFPYLNWAFYHYSPYTTLFILNEIYPLSYEADETDSQIMIESECLISEYYCKEKVYLSHMWHASEMFLLLITE